MVSHLLSNALFCYSMAGNYEGDYGESRSCGQGGGAASTSSPRGFDVNRFPSSADNDIEDDYDAAVSSPNSTISSFQMDFAICHAASAVKRERDGERDKKQGF